MPDEFKYEIFLQHSPDDPAAFFRPCSNTNSQNEVDEAMKAKVENLFGLR